MSAPEPSSDWAGTSDWEYIDTPVPVRYALLWAELRSRTVEVQEEAPRWRVPWKESVPPVEEYADESIARMMTENRPPLAVNTGGGYRKPKFVWTTPIQALRRPSRQIAGLKYERAQLGGSLSTDDLARIDFMSGSAAGWIIREYGEVTTRRGRGRPMVENPSAATLRKRKQRERERMKAEALREVKSSLDRIENKIDHEQALMALRFSRLLQAAEDQEVVEPEAD
jgi:hypothetical protein